MLIIALIFNNLKSIFLDERMTRGIGFFNIGRFSKISLTVIFISVICYIPSVDAYQTSTKYEPVYGVDEEYKTHLQVVIRDKNNQLISVSESTATIRFHTYLPNGDPVPQWIPIALDRVLMKNYQSVTVDDKQYEKTEFKVVYENSISEFPSADSFLDLCMNLEVYGPTCVTSFVATLPMIILEKGDIVTYQWTVLRIIS